MKRRAYVLLSGGIDSTTCLHIANVEFDGEVIGVSIDYGQRHRKELKAAEQQCRLLRCPHVVLDLKHVIPRTMLTDHSQAVPAMSYSEIEGVSPTYVPFRNGLMLSALASYVHGHYEDERRQRPAMLAGPEWGLYFGAHSEDAHNWAYPDCTPEFIGAVANAIYIGTYRAVRLHTPLQWLGKAAIITEGNKLGVKFEHTWSCYKGGELHCGTCPTCRARRDGFEATDVVDPTTYASE